MSSGRKREEVGRKVAGQQRKRGNGEKKKQCGVS